MTDVLQTVGAGETSHATMAGAIRALSMDAVERANSGHPGMPMGMADVATVLFTRFLKFDAAAPDWPDRDRFILSAGHGSMLLYALFYLTGYADMTLEELKNFRQIGARTAGHPEFGHAAGIETTTGPLGQGLANGVGMALAERLLAARFGPGLVDHKTYVLAGDGCLMEGISHEAISLAGHLGLGKLIVLFDDNGISIDGPTDLTVSDDQLTRFRASGWDVVQVDGHDPDAVATAIGVAQGTDQPSLIACRTTIAYGAPTKAGTASAHGAALGADEIAGTRVAIGWPHEPFEVPEATLAAWREVGARGAERRTSWETGLAAVPGAVRQEFERTQGGHVPASVSDAIVKFKHNISDEKPSQATRQSSQDVLDVLAECLPEMIGGSADLTGSNNTRAKAQAIVKRGDYAGSYIYYGVREHGMAAAMNGIALHGGFIPYGGTFLIFSDYCRPSIRLSALMGVRVIYVMTHDSIGLGEDGPTHQPVEQLVSLRAIPNLQVFRPADAVETAECWALALETTTTPSVIALTRQGVPTLRVDHTPENLCARGGYILAEADGGVAKSVLLATGSEVQLAIAAREALQADGVPTRVVSMPCWSLFDGQPEDYRHQVLGNGAVRVAVEAGVALGWEKYTGTGGSVVAMSSFGASAPAKDLFKKFGITVEAVTKAVKENL